MYISNSNLLTGETYDPPKIMWEENDRYAVIAFLLLFVDRKMNDEDLKKLDTFMGITEPESKNNDDGEDDNLSELRTVRDAIIREGGSFLENLDSDEDRYDSIVDEFDRIIDGNDNCEIGGGHAHSGTSSLNNLDGAPYRLFDYLKLVILENGYNGNRKRLMKHLARKWDIDRSVLPILEKSSKALDEINRTRVEIQDSDMSHREAVSALAGLDAREKTVWKELHTLYIDKDRSISVYVTGQNSIARRLASLNGGVVPYECRIRDEDDPVLEEDEDEEDFWDKASEVVVAGIEKVSDLICAPFERMCGIR